MSRTVLITDDAAFMRLTLKNILTAHGYDVVDEAANGQEAVEKYTLHQPDLVLMDVTMPVMDGIMATRTITCGDPDAKVVLCTALSHEAVVDQAMRAGAKDFIVKPFHPARVIESIRKLIG